HPFPTRRSSDLRSNAPPAQCRRRCFRTRACAGSAGRPSFAASGTGSGTMGEQMARHVSAGIGALLLAIVVLGPVTASAAGQAPAPGERPRAREAGIVIGSLPTGPLNALVDVRGVAVGHATVTEGDAVHTGVTAILPHPGDLYRERVPAAIHVGNGYGKLLGVTQVRELGELETPILLTGTLSVWRAADALVTWMLGRPGMEQVRSLNPVVGETNDGYLSDIRARPIAPEHVVAALEGAATTNVEEGVVGAGAGTVAFGWKGGIGTSSRVVPEGHTVGVMVQSNFGGELVVAGRSMRDVLPDPASCNAVSCPPHAGDGSIMIVVATDAPLDARGLERLAARALIGLGRTGSTMSNGSGDYVIAFSTAESVRLDAGRARHELQRLSNEAMTPLFQAVAEATEE